MVTLKIGLITGIIAGVLTTLVIHIVINKTVSLFVRNVLKPNVLMYQEEGHNDFYVSVKHFCSFLNYYRLKEKLDAIPEDQDVIIDFSLCSFVDHTVMENMHNYHELFIKRGGHFDVIGLDMHNSDSEHPYALRRLLPVPKIIQNNLTRRQTNMESLAQNYHLAYAPKKIKDIEFLYNFLFLIPKPSIIFIIN